MDPQIQPQPPQQINQYPQQIPVGPPGYGKTIPVTPELIAHAQNHKPPTVLIVIAIILGLLTITFIALTFVFYAQMQDYKNNSDQKSAAAVEVAKKEQEEALNKQFAEDEKEPYISYTSPSNAAAVKIVYPKTWSLYAVDGKNGNTVETYFNPNYVPDVANEANVMALRMQVLDRVYAQVTKEYEDEIKKGEVTVTPYKPEAIPSAETGIRITGAVAKGKRGTMVILPVRDKTIKMWTESENYNADFDGVVLKNLTFNP